MNDFVTSLPDAVYFKNDDYQTVGIVSKHNAETVYTIQKEIYQDKNKNQQQSWNLSIHINTVLGETGLEYLNGATIQQACIFKKSIRHMEVLNRKFSEHKSGAITEFTIYDNELDKTDGGCFKIQFNSGMDIKQSDILQAAEIEFIKITITPKSYHTKQGNKQQISKSTIIGGSDMRAFATLVKDAAKFHKILTARLGIDFNTEVTTNSLVATAQAIKKRQSSTSINKISEKRKRATPQTPQTPQTPSIDVTNNTISEDSYSGSEDDDCVAPTTYFPKNN